MADEPKSERLTMLDQVFSLMSEFRDIMADFRRMTPDERAQLVDTLRTAWRAVQHKDKPPPA